MKKEIPTSEAIQPKEKPVSDIRAFFTKDIIEQMSEMSLKEMESVLRELVSSRTFIAMLKYSNVRTPLLESMLRGTNPTKDPHSISYAQGCMAGLDDLNSYIIELNAPKPKETQTGDGDTEPRAEGTIMG